MADWTDNDPEIDSAQPKHHDGGRAPDSAKQFWSDVNESIDRLRANPNAWKDYKEEIELLQGSNEVLDEPYFTSEEEAAIRSRNRPAEPS